MTYVAIPGGFWIPTWPIHFGRDVTVPATTDGLLLDADEEEVQLLGFLCLAGGSAGGTKTFGTSGSAIGWLPGASIAFVSSATLTVGVKKASTIDLTAGPPARATIGASAFDVSKALIGGTDTITSTTWRSDAMSAGTPFTCTHGDLIAVCFHLDLVSGTQSIKVRASGGTNVGIPGSTLVTSGPTYTAAGNMPNCLIKFDDGTFGWLDGCVTFSALASSTIGNTNTLGNVFRPPVNCKVDAVSGLFQSTGTTNYDFGIFNSDGSTVSTVSVDPQFAAGSATSKVVPLPSPVTLTAATDYVVGVKQNSATNLTVTGLDVNAAADLQVGGLDSTCYAALSTAGGAFAATNSGKRRFTLFARVSHLDDGAGGSGGFPVLGGPFT
jgi:hypothetical protein